MRNIVIIAAAIAVLFGAAGTASAHSRHHHHNAPAPRAQAYYVVPVRHSVIEPGAFVCDLNPWQTPFQCGTGGDGQ